MTEVESVTELSAEQNAINVTLKDEGEILNVKKYGAKGDGKKRDTEAIQKVINICPKEGKVVIPAGIFLVDHIDLKSDMTLELGEGAILTFIGYKEGGNYPEINAELPGPDGNVVYRNTSLITGLNVQNVTITGEGTIDANGETWWPFADKIRRPFTLEFILSSNILVQGITIQDPPAWNGTGTVLHFHEGTKGVTLIGNEFSQAKVLYTLGSGVSPEDIFETCNHLPG